VTSPFKRLFMAMVVDLPEGAVLQAAEDDLAVARSADLTKATVVVDLSRAADPTPRLARLLGGPAPRSITVVALGSEEAAQALVDDALPAGRRPVVAGADPRSEEVWGASLEGTLGAVLRGEGHVDPARFQARLQAAVQAGRRQREVGRRLLSKRPVVTTVLIAVNVAFFLVQVALGGSWDLSIPLALRMGALERSLVWSGEVHRLIASAFLHYGVLHLAGNMFALYIIGHFAERILGPRRYLVLYAAAALGGGVFALFLGPVNAVSAGASGAVWGMLGAHAALAFGPGRLPAHMIPSARRAAMSNLVLNIAISFHPQVSWAAHAGGGIVGAVLVFTLLSRGIREGESTARDGRAWTVAAALAALLLAVCALAGPLVGRAWEHRPESSVVSALSPGE
jgi:membrane associated rhomboid family serine protease